MRSINSAQLGDVALLSLDLHRVGALGIETSVDEVVERRETLQPVLPPEFVEPRHTALAIAQDVERRDVELFRHARNARHRQVLQELRMVAERQGAQALAAERNS